MWQAFSSELLKREYSYLHLYYSDQTATLTADIRNDRFCLHSKEDNERIVFRKAGHGHTSVIPGHEGTGDRTIASTCTSSRSVWLCFSWDSEQSSQARISASFLVFASLGSDCRVRVSRSNCEICGRRRFSEYASGRKCLER